MSVKNIVQVQTETLDEIIVILKDWIEEVKDEYVGERDLPDAIEAEIAAYKNMLKLLESKRAELFKKTRIQKLKGDGRW
jgi:hypothetical protein